MALFQICTRPFWGSWEQPVKSSYSHTGFYVYVVAYMDCTMASAAPLLEGPCFEFTRHVDGSSYRACMKTPDSTEHQINLCPRGVLLIEIGTFELWLFPRDSKALGPVLMFSYLFPNIKHNYVYATLFRHEIYCVDA